MVASLCVVLLQALQPPVATVVRTEGGINPAEEKVVFFQDGTTVWESWSLAKREKQRVQGRLGRMQMLQLQELVAKAEKARWPATLNHAQGTQTAFTVTLSWRWHGPEKTVTGYPFGDPPLPQKFQELIDALLTLAQDAVASAGSR